MLRLPRSCSTRRPFDALSQPSAFLAPSPECPRDLAREKKGRAEGAAADAHQGRVRHPSLASEGSEAAGRALKRAAHGSGHTVGGHYTNMV